MITLVSLLRTSLLFLILQSSFIVFRLNLFNIIGTEYKRGQGLSPYSKGIYSLDALTP